MWNFQVPGGGVKIKMKKGETELAIWTRESHAAWGSPVKHAFSLD